MKKLVLFVASTLLTACASSPTNLPNNLETESGAGGGKYLKHVYFDYVSSSPSEFEQAKQCVAINVDNRTQVITDSSRSWVGPYTKNYYQGGNTTTVTGGEVIESVSASLKSVVANGNLAYSTGLTSDILRFKLILSLANNGSRISFVNIERAQKDTGILANDGFAPVGVWLGSRYSQAYDALEGKANSIASCINHTAS